MATVAIENVSKYFGPVHALKGIDIEIDDGEFVALVGPSGCGKSTLLRLIAGLEDISGGDISIGGQIVNELTPRERNIAMVFQNYALYPHMSVTDNMSFSLRLKKEEKTVVHQAVSKAANTLGLETLLERFPSQLSGGQRQRVAMGRALVRDSKVFLFDEPLSNLDAQLRVQMRSEIKQLHQNLKNTMIYVTHDQIEAMTMADRIFVMRDGVIEQVGEPLELYDRPGNTFVASFIGSPTMNLISGRAIKRGTRWQFETASGAFLPMPKKTPQIPDGIELVYGIRPEILNPAEEGLEGKIILVEPTGSDINLIVDLSGTSLHCLSRQRARYRPGDDMKFSIDTQYVHLFNIDSGERIN